MVQFLNRTQVRSLPCLEYLVTESVRAFVETWLMWPWRRKFYAISPIVMQPLLALPAVVTFDSNVVDIGTKQKPCCLCWKKTKAILLMPEQNKSNVVDAGTKQKSLCWYRKKTKATYYWLQNTTKAMFAGTKQKFVLSLPEQNKDCVADAGTKQKPYCWCWKKTKVTLLIWEENMLMPDKRNCVVYA